MPTNIITEMVKGENIMTMQELFEKLGKLEGGAEMVAVLQGEFKKLNGEAAKSRIDKKKLLEALELTETDDVESVIEDFKQMKKAGVKPDAIDALTKQVNKLLKENAAEKEARAKERSKRIDSEKYNRALTALKAGNAVNDAEIAKIIVQSIVAKDDDSLAFMSGENEMSIEQGVKAWLDSNKWAVKDIQTPGSGSSSKSADGFENPFKTGNMTKQAELYRTDPALYKKLEAEASKK